jgi:hypothetical protein
MAYYLEGTTLQIFNGVMTPVVTDALMQIFAEAVLGRNLQRLARIKPCRASPVFLVAC